MTIQKFTIRGACIAFAAAGLFGCADAASETPERLDQLVIEDPDFDFATSRAVQLRLEKSADQAPVAVEVTDVEGRRLMDGAFRSTATIDLKIPVGSEGRLTVRTGQGEQAKSQDVTLDDAGRATAQF